MNIFEGPHAAFIGASYACAVLIVSGLLLAIVRDYRAQKRALIRLEDAGIRRRSDPASS